jgi:hypothetical protein
MNDLGRVAYDAFCKQVGLTTTKGESFPLWDELPDRRRVAWRVAATAVAAAIENKATHA